MIFQLITTQVFQSPTFLNENSRNIKLSCVLKIHFSLHHFLVDSKQNAKTVDNNKKSKNAKGAEEDKTSIAHQTTQAALQFGVLV